MHKWISLSIVIAVAALQCKPAAEHRFPVTGSIERLDAALDSIIAKDAAIEVIAEGFDWSEGPLWLEKDSMLIFSDVPQNTIYKWTARGKEVYLKPSGYTDTVKRGGETGSNGLTLDGRGNLILCQCGNRQIARMDAPTGNPNPLFTSLANNYQGKKFNSPNDVIVSSAGEIFFTDPPYGLEKNMEDPKKEIPFQGVYKIKTDGTVVLLTDSITRPNGIAFFPGEKKLLVANSDPEKPNWYVYDVSGDSISNGHILLSATTTEKNLKGLPDGMKINKDGIVFSAGPGGIWIFDQTGKVLGKIRVDNATSNCAFSPDQRTLYVTNDMRILRIRLR